MPYRANATGMGSSAAAMPLGSATASGMMPAVRDRDPSEVEYADRQARLSHTNRCRVVSQVLAQARARDQERLAVEGYRLYAGEAGEFAESASAAAEAWDEPTTGKGSEPHGR